MNLKEKNKYLDELVDKVKSRCEHIKNDLVSLNVDSVYFSNNVEIGDIPVSFYIVLKEKNDSYIGFQNELNRDSGYFMIFILSELEFNANFKSSSTLVEEF